MKKSGFISILLATIMCFSVLPTKIFAWGKMTHTYTANLIYKDVSSYGVGTVELKYPYDRDPIDIQIPNEFYDAIVAYPDAFRAGALGPDMYPDILTGQMYIHPEDENIDSGEWVTLLCDAVNKMGKDTEGRKIALSFTLGCMLHYCGDLFGHDFVNTFSGGSFPSVASLEMLDLKGERLNNVLSHLSVEKYMDSLLYPTYNSNKDGNIDAPDEFISNVMVFDGNPSAGLAPLYDKYPEFSLALDDVDSDFLSDILDDFFDENKNNVPPHYTAMLALREYVISNADEYREHMEPVSAAITRYNDEWAADIDKGIIAFTEACDNIARRMITKEKNPDIEEKKQEEREEEKNEYWDLSGFNLESLILEHFPREDVEKVQKKLAELDLYGDSFFELVLIELLLRGVITPDMLKAEKSSIMIIKEEFSFWMDEYGVYMLGIPDIIIDGIEIPVIGDIIDVLLLKPIWNWIGGEIKNLAAQWVVCACTGKISHLTGLEPEEAADKINALVSKINDRLEDPKLQLDHPDNPYKPSENNFAELEEHLKTLTDEIRYSISDSELESLYNSLTMFKLVLMGAENYTRFIEANTGVKQTAYSTNTGHLEAAALNFQIKTSDLYLAGTDDNIYVIVYKTNADGSRTQLTRKLLDKSGYNDFESGDNDNYFVELPESVKLEQLEIALAKTPAFDFLPSLTDDWHCENIQVTPMFAGYVLTDPIDLGGIHLKGICRSVTMNFPGALKIKGTETPQSQAVTNLKVRVKVKDVSYAGSDSDIYLVAYNGNTQWAKVCLDKAMYNDLERGDDDTYIIPIGRYNPNYQSIPLDQLRIEFKHDGNDEANWKEVIVTPCYGSLELTAPISLGGKKFEDSIWKPDFQKKLKKATFKQYEQILIQYNTFVDDGLLSYMDSLDGGEEWVDSDNELWANTTLRKDVFFKLFKGFEPEILYTGEPTALHGDPVDIALDFTGVWNGVSNDRRSQVKDFGHVYPVEGSADIGLVNEKGDIVYTASKVDVTSSFASNSFDAGKLTPGYYDLIVRYTPNDANPLYTDTSVTIEKALRVIAAEEPAADLVIKTQPKNVTAEAGQKATFNVSVTGGRTPYTYKWQIASGNEDWRDASSSWSTGFDSDSFTFTVDEDEFYTGYEYRCVITDASGKTVTSKTVAVIQETEPLVIQTQPKNVTVEAGQKATFTVSATGGRTPYTYKWQIASGNEDWRDASSSWSTGFDSDSFTFTVDEDEFYTGYEYRCVITDAAGKTVTSKTVAVIQKTEPLAIVTQPQGVTAELGEEATLFVEATGGSAPYSYTWQRINNNEWSVIRDSFRYSGQGKNALLLRAQSSDTIDYIRCIVKDNHGNEVVSDVVAVMVKKAPEPLKIEIQPKSVMVDEGQISTFTVKASGGRAPYTYRWQVPITEGWAMMQDRAPYYVGQGTNTFSCLAYKNVAAKVRCIITDADGYSVISDEATITVINPLEVQINNGESEMEYDAGRGQSKKLIANVTGGVGPYTYTWYVWKEFSSNSWEVASTTSTCDLSTIGVYDDIRIKVEVKDTTGKEVMSSEVNIDVIFIVN